MTDVETQSSQRTVIAFISGLLIGGLLVWVFSSNPEDTKKADEAGATDVEQVDDSTSSTEDADTDTASEDSELKAADQAAGTSVSLEGTTYPEGKGWVVIRDHQDGMTGGILGASRYDTALGLTPTTVELLRPTVSGNTYEAVFYSDAGAASFDLSEDMPMDGTSVTFKAN